MKLGVVIGMVWASRKVPELESCRLNIIQPVTSTGESNGHPLVAADPKGLAGSGDTVVYVTSTDASQIFEKGYAPVNASIVELVNQIA